MFVRKKDGWNIHRLGTIITATAIVADRLFALLLGALLAIGIVIRTISPAGYWLFSSKPDYDGDGNAYLSVVGNTYIFRVSVNLVFGKKSKAASLLLDIIIAVACAFWLNIFI